MTRDIGCLNDYISKLEFRNNTHEKPTFDLNTRSLKNNTIINGLDKQCSERSDDVGLVKTVRNLFIHVLDQKCGQKFDRKYIQNNRELSK